MYPGCSHKLNLDKVVTQYAQPELGEHCPVSLCLSPEGTPLASLDGCLYDQQSPVTMKTKRTLNRQWQDTCEHIDTGGAMHRECDKQRI